MSKPSYELISEIVDAPNAEWLVANIIAAYGRRSAKNAAFVLKEATSVAQNVMLESEKLNDALGDAARSLLAGVPTHNFATQCETFRWLVPICAALAPSPRDALVYDGDGKQYIDQMLDLLHLEGYHGPFNSAFFDFLAPNGTPVDIVDWANNR